MVLFELVNQDESNSVYSNLAASSLMRQYGFVDSLIVASLGIDWCKVSSGMIRALNHHAIACLHVNAGEYRPCEVTVGNHTPPPAYLVPSLMDEMVIDLNRYWDTFDGLVLGAYGLWRLNWIHPFINGNGRTARALCSYIMCVKNGGFATEGEIPVPHLMRTHRDAYVRALQDADSRYAERRPFALRAVIAFLERLSAQSGQTTTPRP